MTSPSAINCSEFFAATELHAIGRARPEVLERARLDPCVQTMLFLAGFCDATALVEFLIPLDPFFAARCAAVNPSEISAKVTGRLIDALARYACNRYGPWRFEVPLRSATAALPVALPVLNRLVDDARCGGAGDPARDRCARRARG